MTDKCCAASSGGFGGILLLGLRHRCRSPPDDPYCCTQYAASVWSTHTMCFSFVRIYPKANAFKEGHKNGKGALQPNGVL